MDGENLRGSKDTLSCSIMVLGPLESDFDDNFFLQVSSFVLKSFLLVSPSHELKVCK